MTVGINTTEQELSKLYSASSGSLPVDFEPELSTSDLVDLVRQHDNKIYSGALYEAIAEHKNINDDVLNELIESKSFDRGVASAIATSGKASVRILEQLISNESASVRQHARLALLQKQLDVSDQAGIERLFHTYFDRDDEFSITVRYLIASHHRTPNKVLAGLSQDEYEHVAQAALQNHNYVFGQS